MAPTRSGIVFQNVGAHWESDTSLFFVLINKTWANESGVTKLVSLNWRNCTCFKKCSAPNNQFYKAKKSLNPFDHTGLKGNNTSNREIDPNTQTYKSNLRGKKASTTQHRGRESVAVSPMVSQVGKKKCLSFHQKFTKKSFHFQSLLKNASHNESTQVLK